VERLRHIDRSPITVRGYRYDLRQFFQWWQQGTGQDTRVEKLTSLDLIRYRQYLVNVRALKPTTINRRLEALRHFCRWAYETKRLKRHIAQEVKPLQVVRNVQPLGLVDAARRAVRTYLATREGVRPTDPLFVSTRGEAMPTRNIQATLTHLTRRAKLRRVRVSAHTLRHTFALTYIRQNRVYLN
jgi:site-specific recombinase XerD